jgi:hypothetical protein
MEAPPGPSPVWRYRLMKDHSGGLLSALFNRHRTTRTPPPEQSVHEGRADALKILNRHHATKGMCCAVDGESWPCSSVKLARTVVPIHRHLSRGE